MLDTAISNFLVQKKEAWLKKNTKSNMDKEQIHVLQKECDQKFSLDAWLPDAARRAKQMSLSTHPCTFSHPSARASKNGVTSSVIASCAQKNDGFLHSGNVTVEQDALGNAAALDVYKFLSLPMEDGRSLLAHLQADTPLAKTLLSIKGVSYEALKADFLAILNSDSKAVTSTCIKQVYFPVADDDYHLLSVLTPSGIVFDLRKRLDALRFSDEAKATRDKRRKNEYSESGYREIYNLTTIGYGGTKPQNISVLNSQNGGKAHLLLSAPPELRQRTVHFPKHCFFQQSVRYKDCRETFLALHAIYAKDENNMDVRRNRDKLYLDIMDYIVSRMWQIRDVADEQYNPDYHSIPRSQRIWLLSVNEKIRHEEEDWLDEIKDAVVRFLMQGYEKVLGKKAYKLGDGESKHIYKLINIYKFIDKYGEVLR